MQAPRDQRVTALRSLGAETMAQLEGELREARLTLFGPMPTSKASKASPPPVETVPPPKQRPAQPPPPKEEPIPAPPKDPPTPRGPPPRDGTPHRERQAARGSDDPAPQRPTARGSDDPAQQRPCKPGHWHNKQGKGKGRIWLVRWRRMGRHPVLRCRAQLRTAPSTAPHTPARTAVQHGRWMGSLFRLSERRRKGQGTAPSIRTAMVPPGLGLPAARPSPGPLPASPRTVPRQQARAL